MAAYRNSSPTTLTYRSVGAALKVLRDPSTETWIANGAAALQQRQLGESILDSVTAGIVSRAMSVLATASDAPTFAYYIRVAAEALEKAVAAPAYSPHELAYIALHNELYTYISRGVLPGDLFQMIMPYLRPPYRSRIPAAGDKLRNGTCHFVSEIEGHSYRCSPLATTNARGEFIISQREAVLCVNVVQLHGAYEFSCLMQPDEEDNWPFIHQRCIIAFSATHVAVCQLRANHTKDQKYSILIRRTDGVAGATGVVIEQRAHRDGVPGSARCMPIVSNGDGTLYVSDYFGLISPRAAITRYRLGNHIPGRGWICDQFLCPTAHGYVYCATGDFICVRDRGQYTVYRLPAEVKQAKFTDAPTELDQFMVGLPEPAHHSLCLDSTGGMLVIDVRADHFNIWSRELGADTHHVLMTAECDYPVLDGHGEFCRPIPVLHPSGRIFVVHERKSADGDRGVYAQELVKE